MNEPFDLKSVGGLVVALYALGAILKHAFPKFPNRLIPVMLLVLGVPSYIIMIAGGKWTGENIIYAAATVAVTIGLHSGLRSSVSKKANLLIVTLSLGLVGCTTVNPDTGQREYDPVKTEQVRAALKPTITELVGRITDENPDFVPYFAQGAGVVCELRDAGKFEPANLRGRLFGLLDNSESVDPLLRTTFSAIVSLFEINYANRLTADLPEDQFAWNLLDVLCDGIRGGLVGKE